MSEDAARDLVKSITQIFSAKGKKVVNLNLKTEKPTWPEIATLIIGPTGNLRAPTLRVGKTLLVGFNSEMYAQAFGV